MSGDSSEKPQARCGELMHDERADRGAYNRPLPIPRRRYKGAEDKGDTAEQIHALNQRSDNIFGALFHVSCSF